MSEVDELEVEFIKPWPRTRKPNPNRAKAWRRLCEALRRGRPPHWRRQLKAWRQHHGQGQGQCR
jgi:hypothetical protein